MDLKLFRNFIEIVEAGSLSAAAKTLYVAQPALTNQLHILEREFGAPLLTRSSRRQELTAAGQLLYNRAKLLLGMENSLRHEIADLHNTQAGTLRIALTPSTAMTMLDGCLTNFARAHPETHYELFETDSFEVINMTENGAADIGLARTPCRLTSEMDVTFIEGEQMIAAYHEACFAFDSAPLQPITILKDKPLCITHRYEEMVRTACESSGFRPDITCTNHHLAVSLIWAKNGMGVAIVPLSSFECVHDNHLRYCILDEPSFATKRVILSMKNRPKGALADAFLSFCKEQLREKAAAKT
mgnify:CR=1 FL=1